MHRLESNPEALPAVQEFFRRALIDFELMETFERRPTWEQNACMEWLEHAGSKREQENRVSCLLDDLFLERPLPSPDGRCRQLELEYVGVADN
jgi:hypothetical protein